MNEDTLLLLKYIDPSGIDRGLHIEDPSAPGEKLCTHKMPQTYRGEGRMVPHVLSATGHRETFAEFKERMGNTVTICDRCKRKAGVS